MNSEKTTIDENEDKTSLEQAREKFINSEGGNKEFREYLWDLCVESYGDECGESAPKLLEPGVFDAGIIGLVEAGAQQNVVVYDYDKICEALAQDYLRFNSEHEKIEEYGFDEAYAEAVDWVEFNTLRSIPYVKAGAPIIIRKCPGLE